MRCVYLAASVALVLGFPATGAGQVVKADYVRTSTLVGSHEIRVIEEGTHYISTRGDGLYRVDRLIGGERTTEIWRPDLGERFTVNHTLGVAQRGLWGEHWNTPMSSINHSQIPPRDGQPPPGPGVTDLGQRAVGPLILHGIRSTIGLNRIETWMVDLTTVPGLPLVVMETTVVSPVEIESIELSSVGRVPQSAGLFEMPAGVSVQDLRQQQGGLVRQR